MQTLYQYSRKQSCYTIILFLKIPESHQQLFYSTQNYYENSAMYLEAKRSSQILSLLFCSPFKWLLEIYQIKYQFTKSINQFATQG